MDYLSSILDAKQNGTVLLIKNFCSDTPSWQEFIDYIDQSSYFNYPGMPTEPNEYDKSLGAEIIGSIMLKRNFYYYITSAGRPMNDTVVDITSKLSKLFNKEVIEVVASIPYCFS